MNNIHKLGIFLLFILGIFAITSCSDGSSDGGGYVFKGDPPVMFSEVCVKNVDYRDEFGEKPGWVEFYNPADTTVSLRGYALTNRADEVLWTFGDVEVEVEPRGYLVVFMSGRDGGDNAAKIHVSFELNKSGGKLFLMDSQRQVRDSVVYPAETKNLSFAKDFKSSKWAFSKPPTPNSANSNEIYEGQAKLVATENIPASGYFKDELLFTLPEGTDGTIYCDTTGASPSKNSKLKSGSALSLTKTTVLRCAQFKDRAYPSEPILRTYIIGERLPSLPVVSIAVDPVDMFDPIVGLYTVNYWENTELPVQIDFFEGDARHAWSYPAGIKMRGGTGSRDNLKKSVSIGFKAKYGHKTLNYPLFPEHPHLTKFNWFILRNNGNNFGEDYIRDMLMTSLTEGLGIDYQKGRSIIVYYNGKYFGIHNLRERSNIDYFETNYGISKNNVVLFKISHQSVDSEVRDILSTTLTYENFERLKKHIDLDNYTNYLQSEIYFINADWPANNFKIWHTTLTNSKWKQLLYDTDHGFSGAIYFSNFKMLDFITELNGPDYPNPPSSTLLIRRLLENPDYKNAFINRFSLLLATYYAPARVEARINALMAPIESEIPLDQQRWGLDEDYMNYQLAIIRNFGRNRPVQMQKEIEEFFGLNNPVDFTLSSKGNGNILVHNLPVLNENATFKAYPLVPVIIKAVPNSGARFKGWSDGNTNAEREMIVKQTIKLEAKFL
jgi:hypothetical protein